MQTFYKLAAPKHFYRYSRKMVPWFRVASISLLLLGIVLGLEFAPADYQQGDAFRIIYVHVPSAILSMGVYFFMASMAAVFLIWRVKLADWVANACAKIGASFTLLALLTGALWGKPTWGTWWIWDARLTSELILLFLYMGVIAIRTAIPDRERAAKASSIVVLVGVVDLPIIHYSVYWWNTLHQKATLLKLQAPSIAPEMLWPLLIMILAFVLFFIYLLLLALQNEILEREQHSTWLKEYQHR